MNEKKKKQLKKHGGHHSGQTFDVMRPGKAPAAATSRPAIVGHKPLVQDPMMTVDTGRRPLMGHHKEVVPALEPAPASESMPAMPGHSAVTETPEHKESAPPAAPQATVGSAPEPARPINTGVPAATNSLSMQGSAEDVAPVLTGQPQMSVHPSSDVPASSASLAQASAKFASDPVPLAPVLQPSLNGGQSAQLHTAPSSSVPDAPASASGVAHSDSIAAAPEPAIRPATLSDAPGSPEELAKTTSAPASELAALLATPPGTQTNARIPAIPPKQTAPKPSAPDIAATPAMPTKFDKPDKPAEPRTPSVAEQIAPKPSQPIKPLPKEAFDALKTDNKNRATPHPSTTVTDAGIVISHHRTGSKHTIFLAALLLIAIVTGFAVWYFLG